MELSLHKLRYIATIARAGSYTKAAEELNVSQPALSRTVAALEAEYNLTIFERGRTGARLTATGAQMLVQIEDVLRNASILADNLMLHGRGEMGRLSLGLGPHIASMFLPDVGRRIMAAKPRIRLRTLIRSSEVLMEEVARNRIDLFISPDYRSDRFPEIETRPIGTVSTDLVVRAEHPLAARGVVQFAEVARYTFATPFDVRWPGDPGVFICDNYYIMRDIVLDSDLVWLCAGRFVHKEIAAGRLVVLSVPDAPAYLGETPIILGRLAGRTPSRLETEVVGMFEAALAATDAGH